MSGLEDDLGVSAPNSTGGHPMGGLEDDLGISSTPEPQQSLHPVWDELAKAGRQIIHDIPRDISEGLLRPGETQSTRVAPGSTADLVGGPMPDIPDIDPKHPIVQSAAAEIADRLGIPKRTANTPISRTVGEALTSAPSALPFGPEAIIPTMASGAASQVAKEAGAGPIGQTVAGLGAGLGPAALSAGIRGAVRGGSGAEMQQNLDTAANAGITLSPGQASNNSVLKSAETAGANIPGGSALAQTRGAGLNKQVENRVSDIVKNLAPDLNQKPPTPTTAGETVQAGLKSRVQGLKNETNEVSNALDRVVPKETPMAAPKLEAMLQKVTQPTGISDVDNLVTGAKTKAVARTVKGVTRQPQVPTSYSTDGEGAHVVTSPNGETHAVEQANGDLKAWRSDTATEAQGQGEGTARLETLAHVATSKGKNLVSDISVSPGQAAAYEKLGRKGWDVQKNPNAEVAPTGNIISDSPKNPVYTVKAPKTQISPEAGTIRQPTESQFSGGWTYNPKTGQSEPITQPSPAEYTPKIQGELNEATPWTFGSLRQLRTTIGREIGPRGNAGQQGQLKQLYGALNDDLDAGVRGQGSQAEQHWDLFNSVAKQNAATQKTLVKAVKDIGGPEAAFKAAMSGSKDGATKLSPVISSLDQDGQNLFRATVLHRLGRAGGAIDAPFDANTFLNNWKSMSPEAKNVLFGEGASAGPPTQLRKSLDSLSDTLSLLQNQGYIKSGFTKGVEQGTSGLKKLGILGVIGYLAHEGGGAVTHAIAGHPFLAAGAAGGAAGVLAGNPIMSRVLTNPRTAAWLAQATKVPKGMVPVLINQLNRMGQKDPDAKDLHDLIQETGSGPTMEAKQEPPQSQDTGLSEDREITNSHKMVKMKGQEGAPYMGVDPNTL